MIREIDLVSYLPEFVRGYKELTATLETENPEFSTAWNAVDKILYNHFISTADESGIARLEHILGIFPTEEDDIESRRVKVQTHWINKLPYTVRTLIEKIKTLSDGADFLISTDLQQEYRLMVNTMLEQVGQVAELERIIAEIVPCNIVTTAENHIYKGADGEVYAGGGVSCADIIEIEN